MNEASLFMVFAESCTPTFAACQRSSSVASGPRSPAVGLTSFEERYWLGSLTNGNWLEFSEFSEIFGLKFLGCVAGGIFLGFLVVLGGCSICIFFLLRDTLTDFGGFSSPGFSQPGGNCLHEGQLMGVKPEMVEAWSEVSEFLKDQ